MKLVDAHCHLESSHLKDNLNEIVHDASNAGIVKMITSSITPDQWPLSESISVKYEQVEFSLGIHPWFLNESFFERINELEDAKKRGAIAIGEIGLDKKISSLNLDMQIEFFESQLAIARKIELPVIIHCRGAFNEIISSIKKNGPLQSGGIVHSFSGSSELAEQFIELGLSFSIGGILTYRNSRKRSELMKRIYPDHFLLETDSPDIPPVSLRGRPNVPSNIIYNLEAAAEILGEPVEKIAFNTTKNASKIFMIDIQE